MLLRNYKKNTFRVLYSFLKKSAYKWTYAVHTHVDQGSTVLFTTIIISLKQDTPHRINYSSMNWINLALWKCAIVALFFSFCYRPLENSSRTSLIWESLSLTHKKSLQCYASYFFNKKNMSGHWTDKGRVKNGSHRHRHACISSTNKRKDNIQF